MESSKIQLKEILIEVYNIEPDFTVNQKEVKVDDLLSHSKEDHVSAVFRFKIVVLKLIEKHKLFKDLNKKILSDIEVCSFYKEEYNEIKGDILQKHKYEVNKSVYKCIINDINDIYAIIERDKISEIKLC